MGGGGVVGVVYFLGTYGGGTDRLEKIGVADLYQILRGHFKERGNAKRLIFSL